MRCIDNDFKGDGIFIINDKKINWICSNKHTNRALRGLTSAGTKGRGITSKGKGSEQARRRKI